MNIHRRALLALALATGAGRAVAGAAPKTRSRSACSRPSRDRSRCSAKTASAARELALDGTQRHGRRQEDRDRQGLVRRLARQRRPRRPQAGRAGRRARSLVGPLSGDEGLAVKDYAKTQPNVTFVNGTSAAQDTTLRDPAPNFFRFSTDGAQWMAGLGTYAFKEKGYKKVATVAEDYSFPYTQVFGFMAEFCKAGGHVPSKSWVPIGNKDFSSVIAAIPDDVDAIYVALGGADGVNFLTQYQQAGGAAPLIGGSITVDQTVLTSQGQAAATS